MEAVATTGAMRRIASSAIGRAGLVAGATTIGTGGAYVATNRGDYLHKGDWYHAAMSTGVVAGVAATAAVFKGRSLISSSHAGTQQLLHDLEMRLDGRATIKADLVRSAIADARDASHPSLERARNGTATVLAGAGLLVGATAATAYTSARLDPGVLQVHVTTEDVSKTGLQKNAEAVGGGVKSVGGKIRDAGGYLWDHIGNPFS